MRPFDESRIYLVLEFFTSHFLEMAKKSNEYRNKGQSYLYMQTAKNLLRILDVRKRQSDSVSDYDLVGQELWRETGDQRQED